MNNPFLEYPELRPYFYDNKKAPENICVKDYNRIIVIAEMFLDTFEWVEHDISQATYIDKKSWRDYMISVYSTSDVIQNFHKANPTWHPLFNNLINSSNIQGSK